MSSDRSRGTGLPEGSVISENAGLDWSEDLGTVFVGTKAQEDEVEDWPDDGLPLADVNIWHWADDRIQSVQQAQAFQRPEPDVSGCDPSERGPDGSPGR